MPPAHADRTTRDRWITVIGVAKLLKCVALVGFGVFVLTLHDTAAAEYLRRWFHGLGFAPGAHLLNRAIARLSGLDRKTLHEVGAAMFAYAALFLIEGAGLLARRRWAEYLTVFITGSFVPFELYELARHVTAGRVVALVLNVMAVAYLVRHLRHTRGARPQAPDARRRDVMRDVAPRETRPGAPTPWRAPGATPRST